jgi:CheY-like chemotaxis protein
MPIKKSVNILVVDNDKSTVETLKATIADNTNYHVDVAYGGQECLDIMKQREKPYDLLILDIMMPKVSGIDVCAAMSKDEKLKKVPVLLASALPVASKTFLESLGSYEELRIAKDVLEKPFFVNELMNKIEDVLKNNK